MLTQVPQKKAIKKYGVGILLFYPNIRLLALPIPWIKQQPTPILTISYNPTGHIRYIYIKWCGVIVHIFTEYKFCENSILEDNFNNTITLTKVLLSTLWHRGMTKVGKRIDIPIGNLTIF